MCTSCGKLPLVTTRHCEPCRVKKNAGDMARWRAGRATRPARPARPTQAEFFWAKVDRTGGPSACWKWSSHVTNNGYGVLSGGYPERRAHRYSFFLARGPIPDDLQVLHRCDNPPCVNPDHLLLGTHGDNMADRQSKGRSLAGASHPRTKLTEAQVKEIRILYAAKTMTGVEIGAIYGIDKSHVYLIGKRKTWKCLP